MLLLNPLISSDIKILLQNRDFLVQFSFVVVVVVEVLPTLLALNTKFGRGFLI
jgi:hypothetical protein